MGLQQKTVFITGASRGIGRAIALKLAAEGANIVIAAKSVTEDPRLGGTIYTVAEEVEQAGGKGLAVQLDIRQEEQVAAAVEQAVSKFGGIDVLINNASAIQLSGTQQTEAKRFDLMHAINVRGTFLMTQHCIPHLKKSSNAHILTLSPPVNLHSKWLAPHVAYTITKYNMSMMALAWAAEFKADKIASNTLWPRTTIATAAVKNLLGGEDLIQRSRSTDIVADAAYYIVSKENLQYTGNNFIDEEVLQAEGVSDFDKYAINPDAGLFPDLFL
ncbi:citronellol/citronellal dehydrogenase [Filimonas lacunae]|uniref:Citronellol/citronellal dehydrogenase n=1 Tax=Filimonas lacunae TaxID=477680 RepID=A0A173MQD4_9BACT|nr:NAD(P)-dependent oxidoreductase [Filimonas lacunae]BAV09873.1 short-chain dehydrogenase/reductase SDR [Filimonas lacunae]SIS80301.1 citronellol/citronellal dehydrogenase [Filimonas lacunae]